MRGNHLMVLVGMLTSYLGGYAIYAATHLLPQSGFSEAFLQRHRGAVEFQDSPAGNLARCVFFPASWATYQSLNIDSEWNQGDCFGYTFCNDDYID